MKFRLDLCFVGYECIEVTANTLEEAEEKAEERFWQIHPEAKKLTTKSITYNLLDAEKEK
jgi:hypothetical protein